MIYEITIGETASLAKDIWLIKATNLAAAVEKAETKRSNLDYYSSGWIITSARLIGKLERA